MQRDLEPAPGADEDGVAPIDVGPDAPGVRALVELAEPGSGRMDA